MPKQNRKIWFWNPARWCRSDTPPTESGWVSPCQHDAVPRQNWLGPDGADLVLLRSACQKGYGCAANAAVGVVANANQCIYAMRGFEDWLRRLRRPDEAPGFARTLENHECAI
jgi:hypothetical protein